MPLPLSGPVEARVIGDGAQHRHTIRGHPYRWHAADVYHVNDRGAHEREQVGTPVLWSGACDDSTRRAYQRALVAAAYNRHTDVGRWMVRRATRAFDAGQYDLLELHVQRIVGLVAPAPVAPAPVAPAPVAPAPVAPAPSPVVQHIPSITEIVMDPAVRDATRQYSLRRFGVELEFFGATADKVVLALAERGIECVVEGYNHSTRLYWKLVHDASVTSAGTGLQRGGHELVSPVLRGRDGLEQLAIVLDALRSIGAQVDRTCGMHVHLDVDQLTAAEVQTAVLGYVRAQQAIDLLVHPSRRQNTYCRAYRESEIEAIERCTTLSGLSCAVSDRGVVVNLQAYARHGTVEFRQHHGTLEFYEVASWLRFCAGLLDAAAAGRRIGTTLSELLAAIVLPATDRPYLLAKARRLAAA